MNREWAGNICSSHTTIISPRLKVTKKVSLCAVVVFLQSKLTFSRNHQTLESPSVVALAYMRGPFGLSLSVLLSNIETVFIIKSIDYRGDVSALFLHVFTFSIMLEKYASCMTIKKKCTSIWTTTEFSLFHITLSQSSAVSNFDSNRTCAMNFLLIFFFSFVARLWIRFFFVCCVLHFCNQPTVSSRETCSEIENEVNEKKMHFFARW